MSNILHFVDQRGLDTQHFIMQGFVQQISSLQDSTMH
jgi:hypothetical protein